MVWSGAVVHLDEMRSMVPPTTGIATARMQAAAMSEYLHPFMTPIARRLPTVGVQIRDQAMNFLMSLAQSWFSPV